MERDPIEGSWTYQRIIKEGRKEGRVEEAHRIIEILAQARFPDLLPLLQSLIAPLTDEAKLQKIFLLVGTANTAAEVQQALSDL